MKCKNYSEINIKDVYLAPNSSNAWPMYYLHHLKVNFYEVEPMT